MFSNRVSGTQLVNLFPRSVSDEALRPIVQNDVVTAVGAGNAIIQVKTIDVRYADKKMRQGGRKNKLAFRKQAVIW
jgi:hypothetical protein